MLTKSETVDDIVYSEEETEQLTPSIGDLIIYNMERVGCENVKETGIYFDVTDDEMYNFMSLTFTYKRKRYDGRVNVNLMEVAIGDILNIDCPDEHTSFKIRLDLPPLDKAALTATSIEELAEALTSEEDWLRKLAQRRFEELTGKVDK